jgi:regulator of sirC expression with transglutaminase-like and TPR domain
MYYKFTINEENKIKSIESQIEKYVEPGTIVVSEEEIKKYVPFKTTLEMLNHYIVDDNGFCPLYEETAND